MIYFDFGNVKVRENENQFPCIAYNIFGSNIFFLIKGIRLSVWATKYVNIDWNGLTNINFASMGTQVEFIDSIKLFFNLCGTTC